MLNNKIYHSQGVMLSLKASLLGTCLLAVQPAAAQEANASAAPAREDGEIIVTARRRDETSIAVPVAITAVGGEELQRRGINGIDGIARLVPQLVVGEGAGNVQGGTIVLRGISGPDQNPFGDQAVAFNIDSVQIARASVRRMGQIDIQQVEVLKGPQALFFGKNSPGGIISIRTADPTPSFEAKASAGYEIEGGEWRGEGYVAGPLTDTLGFRVAVFGSRMSGWLKNVVPDTAALAPDHDRSPRSREFAVRGTLKWEPDDRFSARLKYTYNHLKDLTSSLSNVQYADCPTGAQQYGSGDDCRVNKTVVIGVLGPNFGKADARFGDGSPLLRQTQMLGSLELNYDLGGNLNLTSITGYYKLKLFNRANYTYSYVPATVLASVNFLDVREISEELRLTSSFDGPINFMVGGNYQDSHANTGSVTYFNALTPTFLNNYRLVQNGKAWSVFGQAMWNIVETIELSAGGRYSKETKDLPLVRSGVGLPLVTPVEDHHNWTNFSPEVTLSYRPSQRLTVFASYKRGFLSGGFNSGSTNFARSLVYDQQTIRGFEGGIKASLLDGALRTNLSLYTYSVRGLQVTTVVNTVQSISNAGKAKTKGGEFDFNYRTPLEGLSLHGAVAYNDAGYNVYTAGCYKGQTQAMGCNFGTPVGGFYSQQDLSGGDIARAPKWSGNAGFSYDYPVSEGLKLGLSADAIFSSSYFTDVTNKPAGRQPHYTLFDSSLRLSTVDDRWEVALIGRNLTNKYYYTKNTDATFTGTTAGGLTGVLADTAVGVNRGRELLMRLSVKFGQ